MNKKYMAGILAAAMMTSALSCAAFAGEAPETSERPMNVTIAQRPNHPLISPRPDTPVIAPNPDLTIAPNPAAEMTRGMLITRLWEMSGKPVVNYLMQFEDVTEGAADAEAIRWAASEQLAGGYGNGSFGPNDVLSREQMATIVYRYVQKFDMGFQGAWMFLMPYADRDAVHKWAFEPVMWMVSSRLFDTEKEKLAPQGTVTQGEADALLQGLTQIAAEKNVDFSQYGMN